MDPDKVGPQFKVFPANPKSMGGVPYHTIEVWSPEHVDTEWASTRPEERYTWTGSDVDPGHRPLGAFSWSHRTGEVLGLSVVPEHRRQGMATAMWHEAQNVAAETRGMKPPKHSKHRTNAGDAWARSLGMRLPRRSRDD